MQIEYDPVTKKAVANPSFLAPYRDIKSLIEVCENALLMGDLLTIDEMHSRLLELAIQLGKDSNFGMVVNQLNAKVADIDQTQTKA